MKMIHVQMVEAKGKRQTGLFAFPVCDTMIVPIKPKRHCMQLGGSNFPHAKVFPTIVSHATLQARHF